MMNFSRRIGMMLLFVGLLTCLESNAHSRAETYSKVLFTADLAEIQYTIQISELAERMPAIAFAPNLESQLLSLVSDKYLLFEDGKPCTALAQAKLRRTQKTLELHWQVRCPSTTALRLDNNALFEDWPNHLHISQIKITDKDLFLEHIFSSSALSWQISNPQNKTLTYFIELGFKHILDGLDHLAFLVALLLMVANLRMALVLITGFTIGHSLTLAAAVTGFAKVNGSAVEALIGFSIALIAAEVVCKDKLKNLRWISLGLLAVLLCLTSLSDLFASGPSATTLIGLMVLVFAYLKLAERHPDSAGLKCLITLLFGLIHGFGFAGFLMQMTLTETDRLWWLLGFNIGVELGQILFVLACLLIAWLIKPRLSALQIYYGRSVIAASLCGLGLFWFISRALG